MITLSQQAIIEYQELYKQHFGKEISYEDAMDQGTRLVGLVKAVCFPKRKSPAYTDTYDQQTTSH